VKASTANIVLVPPRFDVVNIEPLDQMQIRKIISARIGQSGEDKTTLILTNPALRDLAKRPVMLDMVLSHLEELQKVQSLSVARIYLVTTESQMRRNLEDARTFMSMVDKLRFLCELAWQMHTSGELRISYKQFPDRIRQLFGEKVIQRELDHWHYDLLGQTLLVRDQDGYYFFSHRGFVEYFVAYRLLAEAGALHETYANSYQPQPCERSESEQISRVDRDELIRTWGDTLLHPNLVALMAEMAKCAELKALLQWGIQRREDAGFLCSNLVSALVMNDATALEGMDLSRGCFRGASLIGASLRRTVFQEADLRGVRFERAVLEDADLRRAKFDGLTLASGFREPQTLAADQCTGTLFFGGHHGGGWVFDAVTNKIFGTYGKDSYGWSCDRAVSPDGRFLLQISHSELRVGRVNREAAQVEWVTREWRGVHCPGVAWHPGGWFMIVELGRCWRWDPNRDALDELSPQPFDAEFRATNDDVRHSVNAAGFLQGREGEADVRRRAVGDGHVLIIAPPLWIIGGHNITIWDADSSKLVKKLDATALFGESVRLSPDTRWLSVSNAAGLSIYSTKTWECVRLPGNSERAQHAWSCDSARIATLVHGKGLVLLSVSEDGALSELAVTRTAWAHGVGFATDDRIVVSGNHSVGVFDAHSGALLEEYLHVPLWRGADLRNVTGLSAGSRAILAKAGARI
jgi:Pentapeptide repeats (8 copies)